MFLEETQSKIVELQNQEEQLTGPNGDKTSTKSEDLLQKEDEKTSSLEVFQLQDYQKANNWQQKLENETEKREKAEQDLSELKIAFEDDKLDLLVENRVLRNLYEEEATLRRDLEKDSYEKKFKMEEFKRKIELLETEKQSREQQGYSSHFGASDFL